MGNLEFTFTDYSPLKPTEDELKDLKTLFGTDLTEPKLLDAFCTAAQKAMEELNGSESVLDISSILFTVKTKKKKDKPPVIFQKWENRWWAQGYVGVICLPLQGQAVVLRFHPRFGPNGGARFLSYVLEKAFELESGETKGFYYKDMAVENTLDAAFNRAILRLFFRQLKTALKHGLYRQYQEFPHNDSNVRGRIDVPRHIRENPLPSGRISYVTREYTADNAVNQLILKAAACLEQKDRGGYAALLKENEQCARGLATLRGELFDRSQVSNRQAIRNAEKKIVHSVYRDYEPLRNTCIAILRHMGVDPTRNSRSEISGFLLDMPTLWEIFLYNTIFKELADAPGAYRQEDCPILFAIEEPKDESKDEPEDESKDEPEDEPEDEPKDESKDESEDEPEDESKWRRSVRPDYLFRNLEVTLDGGKYKGVVLDAKYKSVWKEAYERDDWKDTAEEGGFDASEIRKDVFQVIAYMNVFQYKVGGVVFPVSGNVTKRPTQFKIRESQPDHFLLLPYFIPEGSESFEDNMKKNARRILRALGK